MTIYIENLTFDAVIGIMEFERKKPQKVIVTCKIDYDYVHDRFINYADVAVFIEKTMQENRYALLEDAIESIAEIFARRYDNATSLYLKITKPAIIENATVSVSNFFDFS